MSDPADWALCQLYTEDADDLTAPWVSAWTVRQTAGAGPTTYAVEGKIEVSVHRADGSLIDSYVIDSYGQTEVAADASYCEVSDFTLTDIAPTS